MTSSKRLFVGSLPFRFSEGELLDIFAPYGRVIFIRIVKDKYHKSRGMAFVEYDNPASAAAAQKELHGTTVVDRTIIVDFAKPDPALTEEGMARRRDAISRRSDNIRPPHRNQDLSSDPESRPRDKRFKNRRPFKSGSSTPPKTRLRQTVFNSRFHGARSGRKFASRTKPRR